jgi:hypothetical protein
LNIPCWYGRYFWICFKKGHWEVQETKSFRLFALPATPCDK